MWTFDISVFSIDESIHSVVDMFCIVLRNILSAFIFLTYWFVIAVVPMQPSPIARGFKEEVRSAGSWPRHYSLLGECGKKVWLDSDTNLAYAGQTVFRMVYDSNYNKRVSLLYF